MSAKYGNFTRITVVLLSTVIDGHFYMPAFMGMPLTLSKHKGTNGHILRSMLRISQNLWHCLIYLFYKAISEANQTYTIIQWHILQLLQQKDQLLNKTAFQQHFFSQDNTTLYQQ